MRREHPQTPMYNAVSTATDPHALSGDVFYHYPCADLRCLCGAHEVQCDGVVFHSVGNARLLSAGALGVGRRHLGFW